MDRWAQHHLPTLEQGLDDDERLIDAARALVVRVDQLDLSGRTAPKRARLTQRATLSVTTARAHDIDLPARFFIVGLTQSHLVFWRASRLLARPQTIACKVPMTKVVRMAGTRRFGPSRVSVLIDDGTVLVLRPFGGRRIEHLVEAYTGGRATRPRSAAPAGESQTTATDSAK